MLKNRELLYSITKKDLNITYFSGTGSGGQHRNKHQNCVRMTHTESGTTVTGQSNRDRISNLREAFGNLTYNPKFKIWHLQKIHERLSGKKIEEIVEQEMESKNLKVEIKNEKGQWIEEGVEK